MKYKLLYIALSGFMIYSSISNAQKLNSHFIDFNKCVNILGDSIKSIKQLKGKYLLIETSFTDSSAFIKDREQYFMDVYYHYKNNGFEWITINNSTTCTLLLLNPEGTVCATEKQIKGSGLEKILNIQIPQVPTYITINQEQVKNIISKDKNIQIVDVRTKEEYEKGSIKNAISIDIRKEDFEIKADSLLDKSKNIIVFCKGGVRSRKAAWKLIDKGFKVYNIDKGYDSLIQKEAK